MREVTCDFETASETDLKKAGAWVYSECPTTEILCLFVSYGDTAPVGYYGADLFYRPDHPLAKAIEAGDLFIAQGAGFEKAIWRNIMMLFYGWPNVPDRQWHCTQSVCAMKALPLGLDKAASVLRLNEQKDTVGSKLTIGLSKPKRGYYNRSPEILSRVYSYCAQDVRTEIEMHKRVGFLQPSERQVYLLDQRINQRGVRIDLEYVAACEEVVQKAMTPLLGEFGSLTGGLKPTQTAKLLKWTQDKGVNIGSWDGVGEERVWKPNLRKDTIVKLLGMEEEDADDGEDEDSYEGPSETPLFALPGEVRRVLDIRRICGSASIKKLGAMRACVSRDGRVRGAVQYHGTTTGRWAGRLFQPHNFPRPTLSVGDVDKTGAVIRKMVKWQDIYSAISRRDVEEIAFMYGDPIETVISGLRHCIISDPGRDLCIGDFKTVEARIVLALAGQYDKVQLIADGKDIYIDMAQTIFKRLIDKDKNPMERTIGKQTVLGAGFGMGAPKFQKNYAQGQDLEFCTKVIDAYRKDFAPEVPKLWYGLEDAAAKTVWDRTPHEAFGVRYAIEDLWLTARLPSGRKLYYTNPRPVKRAMPWDEDDIRAGWTFQAQKMGRWRTIDAYGGLLTENVVSGLAADLLRAAMFRCEKNNLPVVLTVHDEIITEPLTGQSDAKLLEHLMSERDPWAVELQIPVGADTWNGDGRYRK